MLPALKLEAFNLSSILASTPALILTRLIKKNLTDQARKLAAVNPDLFLNRTSYSGYFTVDEKHNSNLFFWYIEAENYRPDTPWIVWLQGGPGATSLAGLFDEIGPFEYSDSKLKARQNTWAKDHSLLFIDNPVGTGFSFTDSPKGFIQDMATCSSHLYNALRQFLMVFPELRKAPLYIAGESYAGRYIPALGVKILEQDRDIGLMEVNLQGIILGNPVLSRDSIADYSTIYYQWGLIDSQGMLAVKPLQTAYNKALDSEDSSKASLLRDELLTRLDDISMQQQTFNILLDGISNLDAFSTYINHPEVKEALHVGDIKFNFFNSTVHARLTPDFLSEVRSKVEMLLDHYRVLIYCGQMDLTAPCVPNAQSRRKHWHWNYRQQFLDASRKPWWFNNRVAGYIKSGGGLTEVLVRGAGHLVPMDKPAETTHLISYFIRGLDMQIPPNYQILAQDTPKYIDDEFEGISKTIYKFPGESSSGTKVAMVVSVVLNVLLLLAIVCGIVYALRWKRRTDAYLYNTMEDTNIVSTMF
ncbi:venom serine carboxypeptidase-like isoform X2 [Anticarsia gemmatalis]|uniref:venom serine carboxypeptidase-like isoform X2 n=1 Tax=Anticarsia gemmatalis TaxID=129554 RepID=UPI003F768995